MQMNPFVFRNYDIRGIVDEDFDVEKVEAIGKAYGTLLYRRKIRQAVVGRDCRLSGPAYQEAFMKGLRSTGVDVVDIGEVMTMMVYYGQYRFQVNGCAMITASHNPWNFNGFKLGIGYSLTTGPEEVQEIRRYIESEKFYQAEKSGSYEAADITEDYFKDVLKRIKLKKKFKVVIDSGMGTTGNYAPELFERAGCEVIAKNITVDGHFPIGTPDPTATEVMERVRTEVLKEKADMGFAFDGDGDRIGTVDEKGRVLWNDVLVAIFAKEILERFPGSKIVHNTLCSQVVREVVRQNGGTPIIWKTGHSFIKSKIAEEHAAFGGELSGHFFFADNAYGHDDGCYAVLRVLEYLSDSGHTLSQLYETFPQFISSPEIKLGCADDRKVAIVAEIAKRFQADFPDADITNDKVIPGDDGTRADFKDGMMVFRYSQNGPYITVKFEAKDQTTYDERKKYVREMLESYPEINWEDQLVVNADSLK
ncbi:MAG: phosphomannomutase/phosphoglucomutase [Parcubacteria group bacterium]|nr:phosphomannomutase/phosphoglucomutase [Parcubacteria group bacterium]